MNVEGSSHGLILGYLEGLRKTWKISIRVVNVMGRFESSISGIQIRSHLNQLSQ
jgi:hypothetical protein